MVNWWLILVDYHYRTLPKWIGSSFNNNFYTTPLKLTWLAGNHHFYQEMHLQMVVFHCVFGFSGMFFSSYNKQPGSWTFGDWKLDFFFPGKVSCFLHTLPATNILLAPKHGWLEDQFLGWLPGRCYASFREGTGLLFCRYEWTWYWPSSVGCTLFFSKTVVTSWYILFLRWHEIAWCEWSPTYPTLPFKTMYTMAT